ncbi:MAG TPA: winged helix-turn-helix domain-containing protein [Allosphingosinicella sp.]|nr:winged helix-turn-helix domain-containing protein [Allosphingosinicella sp.]
MRAVPVDMIKLTHVQDFSLGRARISPSTRSIAGPAGKAAMEPRMMQVLVALSRTPGSLVTRERLLELCWGSAAIGDDSLNRAVAGLRRALRKTVGDCIRLETVPAAGYVLTVDQVTDGIEQSAAEALAAGWRSWKLGLPQVDHGAIAQLRQAAHVQPDNAHVQGMLALILRNAAEYADLDLCPAMVGECESSAGLALALDPHQNHARSALIGLPPLFGDWLPRRGKLLELLEQAPDDLVAMHDLAILDMATGRPSAAAALGARLMELEPLAATFHYKRTYHLWSAGKAMEMDHVADRAMQLWPRHPAIWFARLWTLAFTDRPHQALQQLQEQGSRPDLPPPVLSTLERTLAALIDPHDRRAHQAAVAANLEAAQRGPAQCVAATMHLAGLGEPEAALRVAEGYLLRRGPIGVGLHKSDTDPSITDQHRRITQMLFLPVTACMRDDPAFLPLCEGIGMAAYWEAAGVTPDFMAAATI